MTKESEVLLDHVLKLSAIDRAAIAERLLTSLDRPDPAADVIWAREAEARIAAFSEGRIGAVSEEEAFADLDEREMTWKT